VLEAGCALNLLILKSHIYFPRHQLNAKKCGSGLLRVVSEMKSGHEILDDPEYHDVCPAIAVIDN